MGKIQSVSSEGSMPLVWEDSTKSMLTMHHFLEDENAVSVVVTYSDGVTITFTKENA